MVRGSWGKPTRKAGVTMAGASETAPLTVAMPNLPPATDGALDLQANADYPISMGDYGAVLAGHKQTLFVTLNRLGATKQEKRLVIAVAMGETNTMSIAERDRSKDFTDAANVSILNLNIGMLKALGYAGGDAGAALNDEANLPVAVGYALRGLRQWGAAGFLNFHRGGSTGFADGVSFGCKAYRSAIATVQAMLMNDFDLARNDGRRVEADVPHV